MNHATKYMDDKQTTATAKNNPQVVDEQSSRDFSRRNFLKLGISTLSVLATLELGGAGLLYLRARSLEGEFGGVVTVGEVTEFPHGSVTEFVDGNFFLVRSQDGGFLALYRRCPHLGCTVNWVAEEGRFYCPCHASSFDIYGSFESQPVPRALDLFPLHFDGEQIKVDTTHLERRERFSPDQLVYYQGA